MQIKTGWVFKNISIKQIDDFSSTFDWFPGDLPEYDRNSIDQKAKQFADFFNGEIVNLE